MINAVIIDDEKSGIENLKVLLTKYCPQVKIVGQAGNPDQARKAIAEYDPALIFLDVEMPFGNGFDLLAGYEQITFEVIFVTAFEKYALQALRVAACDYILKPINITELIAAVNKAAERIALKTERIQLNTLLNNLKSLDKERKIALPTLHGMIFVKMLDIISCEASGSYTWFYFTNRDKLLVTKNLGEYEDLLEDQCFMRVHHAHLINTHHITEFRKADSPHVLMSNGASVPVSRRKHETLLTYLQSVTG